MNGKNPNTNVCKRQERNIKPFDYKRLSTREVFSLSVFALKSRCLTPGQRMRLIFACQFACENDVQ